MAKVKKSVNTAAPVETQAEETQEVPSFNLNRDSLEYSDDAQLQDDLDKSGGKYFDDAGNVDLEVIAADFHKNKDTQSIYCKGDSTWFNVKITYRGPGDKEIDHWVQVPTSKIKFGQKDTLAVFKKLQQFFFGIGEEVTLSNLGALVAKYFADPSALIGIKVNADLGYEGPYVARLPDSENYGIFVRDEPIKEDDKVLEMPDKKSAIQLAKGRNITPGFIRILKFSVKKSAPGKKATKPAPVAAKAAAPAAKPAAKPAPAKAKKAPVTVEVEEEEEEAAEEETEEADGW